MIISIICCFRPQIPYLRKFLFLTYGPKYSQPIKLQDFLINHISRTNQWWISEGFNLIIYAFNQKVRRGKFQNLRNHYVQKQLSISFLLKNLFLKFPQSFKGNTCVGPSFLIATLYKKRLWSGVFLWILRNL